MPKKVLMIGGGIAGPATALFLRRAGFEPAVYEARSATEAEGGFFSYLAPNGMNVLKTLGVEQQLEQVGFPPTGITFLNAKGKEIGALDNRFDGERYGAQGLIVNRSTLQTVLRGEAERHAIPFCFGGKLKEVEILGEAGVVAHFENGTSARGDLLIGCDGIYSRTRQLIFPESPNPTYLGLIDAGGFAYLPELRHLSGPQVMTFGKWAFFGYVVLPSGEVCWFSNVPTAKEPRRDELITLAADIWKGRLLDLHQDDLHLMSRIIQATPAESIGRWPSRDLPTLPAWHKGPVCIIGDAAHATSPAVGQGASMALEDAAVLGECLRDVADTAQAFATFQRLRQTRVEAVVKQARRNSSRKIPHPVVGWVRDLTLPYFLKMATKAAAKGDGHDVNAYRVAWEEKVA